MPTGMRVLYLTLFGLMLLDGFIHHLAIEWALAAVFACYLAIELMMLERPLLWTIAGLCAAGGAMFMVAPPSLQIVHGLVRNASNFLLVFIAVGFLQEVSRASPTARSAALAMREMAGTNGIVSNLLWHLITAITNFSGVALLSLMYGIDTDPQRRRLLALGIFRACSFAALWSPFFVCLSIVLAVVPGLSWADVALPGVMLAVVFLGANAITATLASGGALRLFTWPIRASSSRPLLLMLAIVFALMVTFFGLWQITGAAVPVVLGAAMPLFALGWSLIEARRKPSPAIAGAFESSLHNGFQRFRKEVLIFFGGSVLGAGMAAIAAAYLDAGALFVGVPSVLLHGGLIAVLLGLTAAGLHPQVVIVIAGPTLVAAGLSIPPLGLAMIMLLVCGLGPLVTPFSALTMFTAKALDVSPWHVAWRWNGAFVAGAAAIGCAAILALENLKGF